VCDAFDPGELGTQQQHNTTTKTRPPCLSVCLSFQRETRLRSQRQAQEKEKKKTKNETKTKTKTKQNKENQAHNKYKKTIAVVKRAFFLSFFLSFETSSSSVLLPLRADGWFDLQNLIQSQQIKATKDLCVCVCVCLSLSLSHTHTLSLASPLLKPNQIKSKQNQRMR
jgi:hypothetical protein